MDVRVGPERRLRAKEFMCLNCGFGQTLGSPLDCKEIKPINPKGNQSWIFIRRTDAETEAAILCSPDSKNWLVRKDSDAGKDWRQEKKGTTEDEMVEWHHWFNGHEFEQTPGDGEGQGSLACCSPWGCKELDMTDQQHQLKKKLYWIWSNVTSVLCFGFLTVKHVGC